MAVKRQMTNKTRRLLMLKWTEVTQKGRGRKREITQGHSKTSKDTDTKCEVMKCCIETEQDDTGHWG